MLTVPIEFDMLVFGVRDGQEQSSSEAPNRLWSRQVRSKDAKSFKEIQLLADECTSSLMEVTYPQRRCEAMRWAVDATCVRVAGVGSGVEPHNREKTTSAVDLLCFPSH